LDELYASLIGTGYEAGRVSHNASAESYDPVLATEPVPGKSLVEAANGFEVLVAFPLARGDKNSVQARFLEALAESATMETIDSFLGDDGDLFVGPPKIDEPPARFREQTPAHQYRVGILPTMKPNRPVFDHGTHPRSTELREAMAKLNPNDDDGLWPSSFFILSSGLWFLEFLT
jgi:hypothetical protein